AGSKAFFAAKTVNLGGDNKPVLFRLSGGAYDLRVAPREHGLPPLEASGIELVAGRGASQSATFGPGKLTLTVSHNGAPIEQPPALRLKRAGARASAPISALLLRKAGSQ